MTLIQFVEQDQVSFDIDDLKIGLFIFVVSKNQNSKAQSLKNEEYDSDTCSRGNVFPRTKQYKTPHDEWTI